jgi:hypothetical protein
MNRKNTRNSTISKISYFLFNSLSKSLNHKCKVIINPKKRQRKIKSKLQDKCIPFQQYRFNPRMNRKNIRAKTNNHGLLTRRQNGPDATS